MKLDTTLALANRTEKMNLAIEFQNVNVDDNLKLIHSDFLSSRFISFSEYLFRIVHLLVHEKDTDIK